MVLCQLARRPGSWVHKQRSRVAHISHLGEGDASGEGRGVTAGVACAPHAKARAKEDDPSGGVRRRRRARTHLQADRPLVTPHQHSGGGAPLLGGDAVVCGQESIPQHDARAVGRAQRSAHACKRARGGGQRVSRRTSEQCARTHRNAQRSTPPGDARLERAHPLAGRTPRPAAQRSPPRPRCARSARQTRRRARQARRPGPHQSRAAGTRRTRRPGGQQSGESQCGDCTPQRRHHPRPCTTPLPPLPHHLIIAAATLCIPRAPRSPGRASRGRAPCATRCSTPTGARR